MLCSPSNLGISFGNLAIAWLKMSLLRKRNAFVAKLHNGKYQFIVSEDQGLSKNKNPDGLNFRVARIYVVQDGVTHMDYVDYGNVEYFEIQSYETKLEPRWAYIPKLGKYVTFRFISQPSIRGLIVPYRREVFEVSSDSDGEVLAVPSDTEVPGLFQYDMFGPFRLRAKGTVADTRFARGFFLAQVSKYELD